MFLSPAQLTQGVRAGTPHTLALPATTTLAVQEIGANAFAIALPLIERVVTINEDDIAIAILRFLELEKSAVEGAATTPLAALPSGQIHDLEDKHIILPICGGNIDPDIISRIIERGLVADDRMDRFSVAINGRPGGLARLAGTINRCGAAIHDIFHDPAFNGPDVAAVQVLCVVETRDPNHIQSLLQT